MEHHGTSWDERVRENNTMEGEIAYTPYLKVVRIIEIYVKGPWM